ALRGEQHDIQGDLAPAPQPPVLVHLVLSAQPFGIAVRRAAWLQRDASKSSGFEHGLGGGCARTAEQEGNRIAPLAPCSNKLAPVVTEVPPVNGPNALQLKPQHAGRP